LFIQANSHKQRDYKTSCEQMITSYYTGVKCDCVPAMQGAHHVK